MFPRHDAASRLAYFALAFLSFATSSLAFTPSPLFSAPTSTSSASSPLARFAVKTNVKGQTYEPQWKKKQTLADEQGSVNDLGFEKVGLKGSIPVIFKQGNETRSSTAFAGQPIRDVASQAGQYIRYGCGKGECGTCECMVNGKWVRPCIATVPAMAADEEFVVQIKAIQAKTTSSGTFFSIKSFFMGFWNNILGMLGMFKFRGAAKKNWGERSEYEDLVRQKTLEKKLRRASEEGGSPDGISPA